MAQTNMVEFQYHGVTNDYQPKVDTIRSGVGGIALIPNASSTDLYTVPTGKVFLLTTYGIYKSGTGFMQIIASTGLATKISIGLVASAYVGETGLDGVTVIASTTTSLAIAASSPTLSGGRVRIGGILRDRTSGEVTG